MAKTKTEEAPMSADEEKARTLAEKVDEAMAENGLDMLQAAVADAVERFSANPGNGRTLFHLKNMESAVASLRDAFATDISNARPEGE